MHTPSQRQPPQIRNKCLCVCSLIKRTETHSYNGCNVAQTLACIEFGRRAAAATATVTAAAAITTIAVAALALAAVAAIVAAIIITLS